MALPATWQFQPGHELSVRHGAFSERRTEPLAAELAAGLLADRPDLGEYPEAVASWADNEARALLLREWLVEHGMFDGKRPRDGPLKWLTVFDRRATEARARLGLDPRSHAELARERGAAALQAVDLEAIRAQGRQHLTLTANEDENGDTPAEASA